MRKHKASSVVNISDESTSDGEQSGEEPNDELSEEPEEELEEEPSEEPSEEYVSQLSSSTDNDEVEQQTAEQSDEPDGKPPEEPSEVYIYELSSDSDTGLKSESVPVNSNEKQSLLDATADKSKPWQACYSGKKCRKEHSLEPESNRGSAVTDLQKKSKSSKAFANDENASEQQGRTGSSGKRRRSKWDIKPEGYREAGEGDQTNKKRKTRWASDDSHLDMLGPIQLPDVVKELIDIDPEIRELNTKLLEINRKLQESEIHDDRQKLIQDRQLILSRLIGKISTFRLSTKNNPSLKLCPDDEPKKFLKKLYIPVRENPEFNFIGHILGPQGNTQKRMEKETGAKIVIRGIGSCRSRKDQRPDPSDNEDLHVLVAADDQKSLDAAVRMVEKILTPVAEGMNDLKRSQLRELAEIKGVLRDSGDQEQKHYGFLGQTPTSKILVSCDTCGGSSHSTVNCPLTASAPGSEVDKNYRSFLDDLGGRGGLTFDISPVSASIPLGHTNSGLGISPSLVYNSATIGHTNSGSGTSPSLGLGHSSSGLGIPPSWSSYSGPLGHTNSGLGISPSLDSYSGPLAHTNSGLGISPSLGSYSGTLGYTNSGLGTSPSLVLGHTNSGLGISASSSSYSGPLGHTNSGLGISPSLGSYSGTLGHTNSGLGTSSSLGSGHTASGLGSVPSLGSYSGPLNHTNSGLGTSSSGSFSGPGLGMTVKTESKSNKVDDTRLFVGYLPHTVDGDQLIKLFFPFGRLEEAKVIKDRSTGLSKGYGFVKYDNPISAATAVTHLNGHKIGRKTLAVRIAGQLPPSGSSVNSLLPKYPGPGVVSQGSNNKTALPGPGSSVNSLLPKYPRPEVVSQGSINQTSWPGPPGSMLPEPEASFPKSEGFGLVPSSASLSFIDSFGKQLPSSFGSLYETSISSPSSLAEFPGYADYPSSHYLSYHTPPTNNPTPLFHHAQSLGSSLTTQPWTPIPRPGSIPKL